MGSSQRELASTSVGQDLKGGLTFSGGEKSPGNWHCNWTLGGEVLPEGKGWGRSLGVSLVEPGRDLRGTR